MYSKTTFSCLLVCLLALTSAFNIGSVFGPVKKISQRGAVVKNACSGQGAEVSRLSDLFDGSHVETDENVNPARKCGFCMG
ncbi:hypothetical protein TrLO_g4944 [Triparma laevis f. longispina]|uniref:Uncharacterized protein n=1 Tax=Triparma laevis f. longispina TaxID=1714387 RepID=A0A9W7KZJ5_9STRA|nr:hypothetical protein TrLO_g4944 [Triparma laevis f. longispina]